MFKRWVGVVFKQVRLLVLLVASVAVAGGVLSYVTAPEDSDAVAARDSGSDKQGIIHDSPAWGDEVLSNVARHMTAGLPIQVANACGLGASSCFRCHNGKRAAAPAEDPAANPWHVQHKNVNYSCVGCHKGNPRLMKKEISHNGLIGKPADQPEAACAECHSGPDLQALVDSYKQLTK